MIQDQIEQHIRPTVESLGYELWGCQYLAQGKHAMLRIYIDKADGIGISDCENVSRHVSALLDVEDPISGHYSLEISSPGMPRPLFYSTQYQQYKGETVEIKLVRPVAGKRKFVGVIVSADEQTLVLNVDNEPQDFLFSTIVKAHLTSK